MTSTTGRPSRSARRRRRPACRAYYCCRPWAQASRAASTFRSSARPKQWVEKSGLEHTIVRPSFIVGEGRRGAQCSALVMSPIPSLRGIEVHELARVFLRALERREQVRNQILEGKSLWKLLE